MQDKEIIMLYFNRDETASEKTFEKYGAYCHTIAKNILGNSEDSEECVNSAMFSLWNSIPPENPENLKIFLAKITRNHAINIIKNKSAEKRGGKLVFEIIDELSECVAAGESVEEDYIAKELGENINIFVGNLSERERNVFIRRYFFLESTETIAKRYLLSKTNVSVILHRTRKKLRKHLEKEGFL